MSLIVSEYWRLIGADEARVLQIEDTACVSVKGDVATRCPKYTTGLNNTL